jgi:hypothetical protein
MPHDRGVIPVLEVGAIVKGLRQHLDGTHDMPCIVLGQLLLLGLSHAHTIIGLSLSASIGAIVSYLFLVGACDDFYSLDLVFVSCQLFLAVLLEASMLPGPIGCAHIVVVWLLQMKCT